MADTLPYMADTTSDTDGDRDDEAARMINLGREEYLQERLNSLGYIPSLKVVHKFSNISEFSNSLIKRL